MSCVSCAGFHDASKRILRKNVFVSFIFPMADTHRRCIYKGDTRTHAQGTDPRVALGA